VSELVSDNCTIDFSEKTSQLFEINYLSVLATNFNLTYNEIESMAALHNETMSMVKEDLSRKAVMMSLFLRLAE
jgi:hypothetical protein